MLLGRVCTDRIEALYQLPLGLLTPSGLIHIIGPQLGNFDISLRHAHTVLLASLVQIPHNGSDEDSAIPADMISVQESLP